MQSRCNYGTANAKKIYLIHQGLKVDI